MSTFKVDTLQSTTGGVTTLTKQSAAKAWCHFTTVTTTAIRGSFNVSSLTDTGTGDTDVSLTNAFTDAYHADNFNVGDGSYGDQSFLQTPPSASIIYCYNYNGGNSVYDSSLCMVTSHGDLA